MMGVGGQGSGVSVISSFVDRLTLSRGTRSRINRLPTPDPRPLTPEARSAS